MLRTGAPPARSWRTRVPKTRSEAPWWDRWSCSDDSAIEEERAGGGPGPTGGGSEQEDRGGSGPTTSGPISGVLAEPDDGGDKPHASGHCMCDLHMHMCCYDRAEVILTHFRSIRFLS